MKATTWAALGLILATFEIPLAYIISFCDTMSYSLSWGMPPAFYIGIITIGIVFVGLYLLGIVFFVIGIKKIVRGNQNEIRDSV